MEFDRRPRKRSNEWNRFSQSPRSFDLGLEKAMALGLDELRWRPMFKMPVMNSILHCPLLPSPKQRPGVLSGKPLNSALLQSGLGTFLVNENLAVRGKMMREEGTLPSFSFYTSTSWLRHCWAPSDCWRPLCIAQPAQPIATPLNVVIAL